MLKKKKKDASSYFPMSLGQKLKLDESQQQARSRHRETEADAAGLSGD